MFRNNRVGIQAWALHAEQYLRQGLEVYCGRAIRFDYFVATVVASEGTFSRRIEIQADVQGFSDESTGVIKGMMHLVAREQKLPWRFRTGDLWWFEVQSSKNQDHWQRYEVDTRATIPEGQVLPYIEVFKINLVGPPENGRGGHSLLDRRITDS